ncbi:MAG: hypothetical protein JWN96_3765, partial [Mycobacterium sp.]|nr:hypothetical protein [Mycobacterium sp.]
AELASLEELAADLTRLLRELGNDPAARRRLAVQGRERATAFSWSRTSQQVLKMVRSGD